LATGKHRMRDQMSTDAEHRGPSHSSSASSDMPSRKPATLESVATISYKNASARPDLRQYSSYSHPTPTTTTTSTNEPDDDRPALPATASWAKPGSGPSTPTLKSDTLPERALTPDNFGPPLAVAVAAAQKQNQQQQQQASTPKRKSEKKKRKEMQKSESSAGSSRPGTPSSVVQPSELEVVPPEPKVPEYYDGLIHFVLGDALLDMCSLADCHAELYEEPVGVSALHDDSDSRFEDNDTTGGGPDLLAEPVMTPLEFLTDAAPSRNYAGSFNPFAHQFLRSTGNLFEAPIRKCSRFGFAQI
jgi:hypothetical protein